MTGRVKYDENGHASFDGDVNTMTEAEAVQMLNVRDLRPAADAIAAKMHDYVSYSLYFQDGVGSEIAKQARKIMGEDRPLNDDDTEFYSFCDHVFNMLALRAYNEFTASLNKTVRRM